MKILKIGGKNLASLAEEFSVDFESGPLAASGLFAISGPTGAGKSTLLDALCLALYDATPRLLKALGRSVLPDVGSETISSQDPRTLLRRGAAEGYAEVDFVGGDGASYRARWSVRRSRTKAEGALQATAMSLHRLPALQAIGGTKTEVKAEIERRVGLSFEQFTRAVLLAQNEFSAFLKAEDNERGELLETLTGSTIYSEISMRAFERAKLEQAALQRLNERLADQKPLIAEQREALQAQSAAADEALAQLDQHKAALERDLRWHQQDAKLRQDVQLAQQSWQVRMADVDAAAARRAALASIEAVQAARPIADDVARINAEIGATQTAMSDNAHQAEQATLAQEQAVMALAQATQRLEQAEAAQRAAAPQLNQAKALDARIETMLPAYSQAATSCENASHAATRAQADLQIKQDQRSQLAVEQDAGAGWLAQHAQWSALAQSWDRWDVLFVQAGQAASQAEKLSRALAKVQHNAAAQRTGEADATAKLALAAERLQTLEVQRQTAIAALAAFPAEALHERRGKLERQRDLLASAEKIWIDLSARQARSAQLDEQVARLRLSKQNAETMLSQVQHEHTGVMAAFVQAERSLKLAEAACAESVEKLRATLEDDAPCPVCGAHDHPYRHDDGALQSMLAGLQQELGRCREQLQQNIEQQATHRTKAQASIEQLTALAAETRALHDALAQASLAWQEHALVKDGPPLPDADARAAWFAQQLADAQTGLQEVERQERSMRAASAAKEQSQLACDQAAAEHHRLLALASSAQTALAQFEAEQKALDQQRIDLALHLSELLADLDPAFSGDEMPSESWKDDWHGGPARFHEARQAESRRWLAQRAAFEQRASAIANADIELKALTQTLDQAMHNALLARAAFDAADQTIRATQDERAALWDGREVSDVEAQLQADADAAKAAQLAQQQASAQAAQTKARLDEALAQASQRIAALQVAATTAAQRLSEWLHTFQLGQPDTQVENLEQLRALLAHPVDAIATERRSLQVIDSAAADAATILKERQRHLEEHGLIAPADGEQSTDALSAALLALTTERKAAHDDATALRLALAQDDARRQQSQSMMAEIEQQEDSERRWARMNELIGSADGKKFRNYAQQFTLDVLLGYANAHLHQLARRYRLERIANPAAPSLGLLVRDLDMGGETRSVHSLSGGESFLVSLALALGLASLSSNRVRVESLFIDEGFGSLDADTLRVAMDALDGLQAMGRKVGVISHVQEMTERISTRILVQPSAGGKSVVLVR